MKNKVCIVVPFRNRESHLETFAPAIENFLKENNVEGKLFVIEQSEGKPFNRAKLLNVGFDFVEKTYPDEYSHYAFHDVDMIPIESDYNYCEFPTHLAARAEQFGYRLPYENYFGGVTIFDKLSFIKVNGYSNDYWGWGAEDDDMFRRCEVMGVKTMRKDGKYQSLSHERVITEELYNKNVYLLRNMMDSFNGSIFTEGLSSLEYELKNETGCGSYFKILVEI